MKLLVKAPIGKIEKIVRTAGSLAARKGNLAKLVAISVKMNARLHLAEVRRR